MVIELIAAVGHFSEENSRKWCNDIGFPIVYEDFLHFMEKSAVIILLFTATIDECFYHSHCLEMFKRILSFYYSYL